MRISAVFLVALVIAGALGTIAWLGAANTATATASVDHTNEVLKKLDYVFEDLVDVEDGARGYALTGDARLLDPNRIGKARWVSDIPELQKLIADNPRQAESVAQLAAMGQRELEFATHVVHLRRDRGAAAAAALIATGSGRPTMEAARGVVAAMRTEENRLLRERMSRAQHRAHVIPFVIAISMAALALIIFLGVYSLTRSITRPLSRLVRAARQFGRGEQPAAPPPRTDEMGDLAHELMEMFRLRHQAEERARALLELAPDAFFQSDLDGRFTDVNPAGLRLLGYEKHELVGKTVFDIVPPDDGARLTATRDRLLAPDQVERSEWTYVRKDGTTVMVEVSAKRLPDGRWEAFARDIGDRKRWELELRESHEDLARAQAVAKVGSWRLDVRRHELRCSSETYRMFGIESDRPLTYAKFLALVHPEDRALVSGRWTAAQHGAPYDLEHRIVVGETTKWVRAKADLDFDEYHVLRGGVGIVEDITERKQAADELRLSEARSSGILSISADALISIDEEQCVTMFNEGAEKIFGYSRAEAIGTPLDRLVPERLRATHREQLARFAAGDTVAAKMGDRAGALIGVRKGGEEFPADASISKLEVDGTRILTIALRDVTDQRRLEGQLRRALRMRDEVLGVVAHDLRNPLATIILQASGLKRRGPEPERRRQRPVDAIARAAQRMNHLIQDLLDVAQVEAGALTVKRARVSAGEVVVEAVDTERSLADAASLRLEPDLPREVPKIFCDRDRLLQVLENLIGNAVKFTPPGGGIRVGTAPQQGEALFWVRDTGFGISAENVGHVFDRFWQAAERGERLGAGLGLAIAKGIVEAHGGHIWVESTVGRGTTFFFTIPETAPIDADAPEPRVDLTRH
jgi:PAS domain S-box-containing protein